MKTLLAHLRLVAVLAAAVAAAALATPPAQAAARAEIVDRGVVQSVTATAIVLRALDGSTAEIALGPATTLRLNGLSATTADIKPGHVAAVFHEPPRPARLVRAFGTSSLRTDTGRITKVRRLLVTLRTADGATVVARVGPRTKIRWSTGTAAQRRALRAGREIRVVHAPGRVAELVVLVRSRP